MSIQTRTAVSLFFVAISVLAGVYNVFVFPDSAKLGCFLFFVGGALLGYQGAWLIQHYVREEK